MIHSTSFPLPRSASRWNEDLTAPNRSPAAWEGVLHHLTWSAISLGMAFRHRMVIEGRENIPLRGPSVIVANHSSHLDTLLLGSVVPATLRSRFSPLAAGDTFFRNKPQSWLSSRFLNLKPLWRKRSTGHSLFRLRQCLGNSDECFLVFPEGSRTRSGSMSRFKPGIGVLVAGTEIPVIPCHIKGTLQAWPSRKRLPSRGTLHLRIGKAQTFSDQERTSDGWRSIARKLEREIKQLGEQSS